MERIDASTYQQLQSQVQTVIGDEKQSTFQPRIKIKRWHNAANFSLGVANMENGTPQLNNGVMEYKKGKQTARFYQLKRKRPKPLASIRRVARGDSWKALEATAEYEMFNQIGESGTLMLAHYVVTEPSLSTFDLMPASMQLDVDSKGMVKDFDYPDKSAYHPKDIPIPKYDRIKLCRFYTPYTPFVNPYYMDEGIHNIDMHWHGTSLKTAVGPLMDAIETVMKRYKIPTKRHETRAKLYFKHKDRWVKFYSGQEEIGGLYSYINIGSSYNKAFDFYRPDVEKDIRDQYAYGLRFAYPSVTHGLVDEVMQEFAKNLGVKLKDQPYDKQEKARWQSIQRLQDNVDWASKGVRKDAGWARRESIDGFEFEVVLSSKPRSNDLPLTANVPKNVIAYVQAPISFQEQLATRSLREPHVWNSLALYHDSLSGNVYQTGKVAHIYRPIAHDAKGYSVFCDFKEVVGKKDGSTIDLSKGLTITIPWDFLNTATYPITVDPTFGYGTAGGSSATLTNTILATTQTTGVAGNITSVSYYLSGAPSSQTDEGALYDSSGSFNRLTYTAENTTEIGSASWVTLPVKNLLSLSASTDYVLAAWGTSVGGQYGNAATLNYDSTVGKTSYSLSSTYVTDGWPATLSGASTQSDRQYSIYASYGVQYPIMVGSVTSLPTASARYTPIMATNDAAWGTNQTNPEALLPVLGTSFHDFKLVQTTAPGASTGRVYLTQANASAGKLTGTISDSSTSLTATNNADALLSGVTYSLSFTLSGTPAASTPNRWRVLHTATNQIFLTASMGTASTSANRYVGLQDSGGLQTAAGTATQVLPEGATLQNLYVKMGGTLSSGSYVVEVYKGGVATGLKVTLDSTNQQALDSTHTVSIMTGDTAYIQVTPSTPSAARSLAIGMEYVSGTAGNGVLLGSNNSNASNSATVYNNWYGTGAWNATESNVQALGAACVITGIYVRLSASPGTSKSRTITLRVNGNDTTATVAISGASTSGSWSGRIEISNDDLICVSQTPAGTPTASSVKYGIIYSTVNTSTGAKRGGMYTLMRVG